MFTKPEVHSHSAAGVYGDSESLAFQEGQINFVLSGSDKIWKNSPQIKRFWTIKRVFVAWHLMVSLTSR